MNRIRAGLVGMLTTALLTLATGPALAQTSSSTTEELIWGLNYELLAIAIPITLLVEGILFYTVWRYRESKVDQAQPTKENRRLEITWTVATAIVLMFVGMGSYFVLANPAVSAPDEPQSDTLNIQVDGQKYYWTYEYPEQNVSTDSNRGELVMPTGTEIRLNVSSNDWLHAFHAPALGLKADAFPGRSNYIQTTISETGTYQLYCAEYCGTGHSQMLGTINVTTPEKFEAWVDQQQAE